MCAELRITWYSFMAVLTIAVYGYAQPQYTVTDLGPFTPSAIAGPWVVGEENNLPIRLNLDTMQKITLGHLGFGGIAYAVLASGEAVGTVYRSASVQDGAATFWDAQGQAFPLPGPLPSEARDLNEAWTVAGSSASCPGGQRAMRWYPTEGRAECLESRVGASWGKAIDGQDRVWGQTSNVVTVWDVGKAPYLLVSERGVQAVVRGGNEVLAVGWAEQPGSFNLLAAHFRFPPAIILLPTLLTGNDIGCSARGINAASVTVGDCAKFSPSRAMLWPDTTSVVDLNTRVQAPFMLESATGINDEGEIIGTSAGRNWLLTPIVSPPAITMLLNQATFTTGDTLHVALRVQQPGPTFTGDFYFGAILPDGTALFLSDAGGIQVRLDNPRAFRPLARHVVFAQGLDLNLNPFFSHTFSGGESPGGYTIFAFFTPPAAFDDDRIDAGDLLALELKSFRFSPSGLVAQLPANVQAIRDRHMNK